jgi:hypothetical protein
MPHHIGKPVRNVKIVHNYYALIDYATTASQIHDTKLVYFYVVSSQCNVAWKVLLQIASIRGLKTKLLDLFG